MPVYARDVLPTMSRFRSIWRELNASLWFVPAWMVGAGVALAFGLVKLDVRLGRGWAVDGALLVGAGAAGARGMLATIAGTSSSA